MTFYRLELFTNALEDQKIFYTQLLGFKLIQENNRSFTVQAGRTELSFLYSPKPTVYHFAFNIPADQMYQAVAWLKELVDLITFEGKEVQDFPNWNAEAIYFYDKGGNIVEFIGRKNLKIADDRVFSAQSVLNVSEIGMPVENVENTAILLDQYFGVKRFSDFTQRFSACGDEEGLFIIVDKATKKWFPTNIPAKPAAFNLIFKQGEKVHEFFFPKSFWSVGVKTL